MDHHQSCVKSNRLGGHTTCVSLSAATRKLLALEVRPGSWRLEFWASWLNETESGTMSCAAAQFWSDWEHLLQPGYDMEEVREELLAEWNEEEEPEGFTLRGDQSKVAAANAADGDRDGAEAGASGDGGGGADGGMPTPRRMWTTLSSWKMVRPRLRRRPPMASGSAAGTTTTTAAAAAAAVARLSGSTREVMFHSYEKSPSARASSFHIGPIRREVVLAQHRTKE